MRLRRYLNMQSWCKLTLGLGLIMLVAGLLLPAMPTNAFSWTELKGTLYTDKSAVPANGTSVVEVLLVVRDQDGHAVDLPLDQIRMHATLGTWAGTPEAEGNGSYTALLIAPTTAGVSYISAEVAGEVVADLARVYVQPGAPSPAYSMMTASHQSLPADGSSQTIISLQLKDAYGNDISEPAEGLQLFTTGGELGSVTHVTYGRYEASVVSAVYGRLGSLIGDGGILHQPQLNWEAGAIPSGTSNHTPLPVSLSFSYESYGTYQVVLRAPSTEGGATVSASLNGVTVTSSVYVAFTQSVISNEMVALSFNQASYSMNIGQQVPVGLNALWSDQSNSSVAQYAAYRVADGSIATVDNGGVVRGLKAGQTVLTATYGSLSKNAEIVVTMPVVDPDTSAEPGKSGVSPPVTPTLPDGIIKVEVVTDKGAAVSQHINLAAIQQGIVPLNMPADGGEIRITGASFGEIRKLNPETVLVLQTGGATMSIPISELSAKAYSEKFNMLENDVLFHFIVRAPDDAMKAAVKRTAERMDAKMLALPMTFEIQVTGENGKSAFISTFHRYVTRTLALQENTVPATATGVWWVPETSEFHYVPTYFEKTNGQWIAVMKRKGASVYTVIERPVSFGDVQNHWGKTSIELLASKLIIEGRSKDAFAPDEPVSRAEVTALLVRSLGLTPIEANSAFIDIAGGWYEQAVNTAHRAGLVTGYEDGTFRPDRSVTREELVQMVIGAMIYTEAKPGGKARTSVITDEGEIAEWALQAVHKASEMGIIDGGGKFRPTSLSTRAETVAMLERMLKLVRFIQ